MYTQWVMQVHIPVLNFQYMKSLWVADASQAYIILKCTYIY